MRPVILLTALLLGVAAVAAADSSRKLAQSVVPSIVNGQDSARVGWFVRIRKLIKGNWSPWCGGMMIGQTHVLTAAHCVIDEDTNSIYDTKILKAAIGIRSNNDKPGVDYDSASVKRIVVHPRYLSALYAQGFDIAILELDPKTVSGKNELVTLPLYVPKPSNPVPAGTRLQVIGFGDLGNGKDATVLQRTELVLERLEACNEAWAVDPTVANFFEATLICAGAPPTNKFTDSCGGDSGGPLYVPRSAGRPYDTAIGIVSFGIDCGVLYNKTEYGKPGVYTNIAQLKRWVKANVACLAQGQACPWGGTCFDNPENGCLTCDVKNPIVCGSCAPGYEVDPFSGQCRPKDCRDVVAGCTACSHRRPFKCAACKFGYKVVNNQCVLKNCLDYDRACRQCDLVNPLTCTACKRHHVLDPATGQCVRLPHHV